LQPFILCKDWRKEVEYNKELLREQNAFENGCDFQTWICGKLSVVVVVVVVVVVYLKTVCKLHIACSVPNYSKV
jgi:hypothetical protein